MEKCSTKKDSVWFKVSSTGTLVQVPAAVKDIIADGRKKVQQE
jgi:hypothetical protein